MDKASVQLTIYFEDPFWVGIFEFLSDGKLTVSKAVFGAEPKDYEVRDFVLARFYKLKSGPAVEANIRQASDNPKRRQRNAGKQLKDTGIGTKSQQALKLMQEEMKTERKKMSKEERDAEKQRIFELKQLKRKSKHRGH